MKQVSFALPGKKKEEKRKTFSALRGVPISHAETHLRPRRCTFQTRHDKRKRPVAHERLISHVLGRVWEY
ncbi:hypothetical protein PUN28_007705 [Cardiocondyla obscurior]|uniref:Ribosomal protein S10 n=1 Tax=Cardiocondyla obscurior TaxID=286306 RepID=A0AAW2FX22_9HYME